MKRSMIALLVALTLGMGTTATAQKQNKQYGDRTEVPANDQRGGGA